MGNRSRIGRVPLHPFHSAKWLHTYQHYKMDTYYKVDGIWTSCFLHNGMLCNNPWTKNTTTWIMRFIPYRMDVLRTHKHSNQIIKQHFLLPFRWMLVGFLPNSILTLVISRWILPMNNWSSYLTSPTDAKKHETLANKGIYKYFEMAWYWLQMHGPTVQRSSLEPHHSIRESSDSWSICYGAFCGCHTHTQQNSWMDLIWFDRELQGAFYWHASLADSANSGMPPAQRFWSFKHQWCDLMQTKISQVILPYHAIPNTSHHPFL